MAERKQLPVTCPSCSRGLKARRFECPACGTSVEGSFDLPLLMRLSPEDQVFILHLVKNSGSLKEMAREYGVSYPTMRNRLDDLIERIKTFEANLPGENEGLQP
jgi:hypothetical protein